MIKKSDSGISLFLMEMMITILLFSICAAICVSIFTNAWLIAESNDDRNHAVTELRNMANCYKAAAGNAEETAALYGGSWQGDELRVYFDTEWNQTDAAGEYMLTLYADPTKKEATIEATKKDGTLLGRIPVKTHEEGGILQ